MLKQTWLGYHGYIAVVLLASPAAVEQAGFSLLGLGRSGQSLGWAARRTRSSLSLTLMNWAAGAAGGTFQAAQDRQGTAGQAR